MQKTNKIQFFYAFLLVCGFTFYSCTDNTTKTIAKSEEKLLLDHISRINDTAGAEQCLHFIDSALAGYTLSSVNMSIIYNRKHTAYLHYLPDFNKAQLYADSR